MLTVTKQTIHSAQAPYQGQQSGDLFDFDEGRSVRVDFLPCIHKRLHMILQGFNAVAMSV